MQAEGDDVRVCVRAAIEGQSEPDPLNPAESHLRVALELLGDIEEFIKAITDKGSNTLWTALPHCAFILIIQCVILVREV